jgi:hypothetical protein
MALTIDPNTKLTLGDILPVPSDSVRLQLVDGCEEWYVTMKRCTKASQRDSLNSYLQVGYIKSTDVEDTIEIGSVWVPGTRGPVSFGRACWMNFVDSYRFPSEDEAKPVVGHAHTSQEHKFRDFEDLFGRGNLVVTRFMEFCRKVHRLDRSEEERVEKELGNSTDGVTPPQGE